MTELLTFGEINLRHYTLFTVGTLFYYLTFKIRSYKITHSLKSIELVTPDVHKITFDPVNNKAFPYKAGQYVFLRFISSALPKESHPFSIVSSPHQEKNSLIVMVKEIGDYTQKMTYLRSEDKVSIEGPYGDFWSNSVASSSTPIVLLAGGIGITPHLSIVNHLLASNSKRDIYLVWGVATIRDAFYLDTFKELQRNNPNFKFNLILSKERHSSYPNGHINSDYLQEVGVADLYSTADFFICGPTGMMDAMESLLLEKGVEPSKIHIESFSF